MISLHAVSGPWTPIVAALDKGRFNIAVCRRYTNSVFSLYRHINYLKHWDHVQKSKAVEWMQAIANADAGLRKLTIRRNTDARLTFPAFRHLLMIIQHHIARISPSAAIYDVQGVPLSTKCSLDVKWISLSRPCQHYERVGCIHFHCQKYRSMDVQGSPFRHQNRIE